MMQILGFRNACFKLQQQKYVNCWWKWWQLYAHWLQMHTNNSSNSHFTETATQPHQI